MCLSVLICLRQANATDALNVCQHPRSVLHSAVSSLNEWMRVGMQKSVLYELMNELCASVLLQFVVERFGLLPPKLFCIQNKKFLKP